MTPVISPPQAHQRGNHRTNASQHVGTVLVLCEKAKEHLRSTRPDLTHRPQTCYKAPSTTAVHWHVKSEITASMRLLSTASAVRAGSWWSAPAIAGEVPTSSAIDSISHRKHEIQRAVGQLQIMKTNEWLAEYERRSALREQLLWMEAADRCAGGLQRHQERWTAPTRSSARAPHYGNPGV